MGRKEGGCCALFAGRELGPRLKQSGLGRGLLPYQVTSTSIQPFGPNRHEPKIGCGAVPSFLGELGPHRTQSRLGRGLPPYQVTSWSILPFGHNGHWQKIGGCVPLGEGELGPYVTLYRLG